MPVALIRCVRLLETFSFKIATHGIVCLAKNHFTSRCADGQRLYSKSPCSTLSTLKCERLNSLLWLKLSDVQHAVYSEDARTWIHSEWAFRRYIYIYTYIFIYILIQRYNRLCINLFIQVEQWRKSNIKLYSFTNWVVNILFKIILNVILIHCNDLLYSSTEILVSSCFPLFPLICSASQAVLRVAERVQVRRCYICVVVASTSLLHLRRCCICVVIYIHKYFQIQVFYICNYIYSLLYLTICKLTSF